MYSLKATGFEMVRWENVYYTYLIAIKTNKQTTGPGKMTQQLRMLAALPEDLLSVHSTYVRQAAHRQL